MLLKDRRINRVRESSTDGMTCVSCLPSLEQTCRTFDQNDQVFVRKLVWKDPTSRRQNDGNDDDDNDDNDGDSNADVDVKRWEEGGCQRLSSLFDVQWKKW